MCNVNVEGNEIEKLTSCKRNSNNCCRQDSFINTKISGQKVRRNRMFAQSQNISSKVLVTTKVKTATLQWRNLVDIILKADKQKDI